MSLKFVIAICQPVLECTRIALNRCENPKFPGGACPQTPLHVGRHSPLIKLPIISPLLQKIFLRHWTYKIATVAIANHEHEVEQSHSEHIHSTLSSPYYTHCNSVGLNLRSKVSPIVQSSPLFTDSQSCMQLFVVL